VWTPAERAGRTGAADTQRGAGIGIGFAGAALLLIGVPLTIWNELQITSTDASVVDFNRRYAAAMCETSFDPRVCTPLRNEGSALQSAHDTEDTLRWISLTTTLVGAIVGGIGLVLWATTPSNEAIDAAAHASLRLTPGGLALSGAF
jgi:hypothetical protein